MGDRDARVRRDPDTGRHAGHDLERDSMPPQILRLLGPAAEDHGISSLEADNRQAGAGVLDEQRIDLVLVECAMPARFARADLEGVGRGEVEQARTCEMIIDDGVAPAQELGPAPGQESRGRQARPPPGRRRLCPGP